jgi:hypothetical protein
MLWSAAKTGSGALCVIGWSARLPNDEEEYPERLRDEACLDARPAVHVFPVQLHLGVAVDFTESAPEPENCSGIRGLICSKRDENCKRDARQATTLNKGV